MSTWSAEEKSKLKEAGHEDLIRIAEINESGYAGYNRMGEVVDRREDPLAIPIQENRLLGIPKSKQLDDDPYEDSFE